MKIENINAIGQWVLLLVLVAGAIIAGIMGKGEIAGSIVVVLVWISMFIFA